MPATAAGGHNNGPGSLNATHRQNSHRAPDLQLKGEPFAALDAALRADLRAEVAATLRRAGATAILVTHDQEEALSFADTIAVLQAGRTAQQAAPQQLYREPADIAIARFLGEANLIPATVADGKAETAFGTLPLTTAQDGERSGLVLLRPRQLRLRTAPAPGTVRARVRTCRFRGHDHRIELVPTAPDGLPPTLIAYTDAPWPTGEAYVEAHGPAHVVEER